MSAPNVTPEEEKMYGGDPAPVRQTKYAGGILKNKPEATVSDLKEALRWKFGACVLSHEILAKMVN